MKEMKGTSTSYQKILGNSLESKLAALLLANQEMTKQQILHLNFLYLDSDDHFLNASFDFPQEFVFNRRISSKQQQKPSEILRTIRTQFVHNIKDCLHSLQDRWEKFDKQRGQLPQFPEEDGYEDMMNLEKKVREATRIYQESSPTVDMPIDNSQYLQTLITQMLTFAKIQAAKAKELSRQIVQKRTAIVLKKIYKIPIDIQRIISQTRSFEEHVRYGGKDMQGLQAKLRKELNKALKFSQEANLTVFRELISNPLSNIIASSPLLTNAQKRLYYHSQFYQSGLLQEYAKVIAYSRSEEGLAQKQRDQFSLYLTQQHHLKLKSTLIDSIINYNLRQFFLDESIRYLKEQIFKDMLQKFKNYYRFSKKRQSSNGKEYKDSQCDSVQLSFALRKIFLEINLDFESWQTAETHILNKRYQIIDDSQLNIEQKFKLRLFILDNIQPYLFKSQNFLEYRERVKEVVMKTFLSEKTLSSKLSFQQIEQLAEDIMKDENYFNTSEREEMSKKDFIKLSQRMANLRELKEYWESKGEDMVEKRYKQQADFTKRYLQSNFDHKIEVSSALLKEMTSVSMKIGVFILFNQENMLLKQQPQGPIFESQVSQIMPIQEFVRQIATDVTCLAFKDQTAKTESLQIVNIVDKEHQNGRQEPESLYILPLQSGKNVEKSFQDQSRSKIDQYSYLTFEYFNQSYNQEDLRRICQRPQFIEQYSYLKQDKDRYPEGSIEKAVQEGLLLAFEVLYMRKQSKFEPMISKIQEAFEKEEQYISQNKAEIEHLISVIARQQNNKERYGQLLRLKKLLLIIDVFELERLIKKTINSRQIIKDKDIILVVGTTGSGKTTNIWRLLGYELQAVQFHGFNIYKTKKELAPNHKSFMASPQSKSCTRYINVAEIPEQMHQEVELGDYQTNLYICDSPGFGDTGRCEIDISNQIGMINALSQCRSVRILLILARDALTGDRMKGARDIAQIMTTLCPKQAIGKSLHIFFNKLKSKEEIPQIRFGIENVIREKQELNLSNKAVTFMKRMKKMAQDQQNFLFPLGESRQAWQQRLYKLHEMSAIDRSQISSELQYTYSQRSKAAITIFLKQRTQRIRKNLDKQDYDRVSYEYSTTSLFIKQFQATAQQQSEYSILVQDFQNNYNKHQNPYRRYLVEIEKKISQRVSEIFIQFQDNLRQILTKKDNKACFQRIQALQNKLIRCQELFAKNIPEIKTKKDFDTLVLNFWDQIIKSLENVQNKNIVQKTQIMVSFCRQFKLENKLVEERRNKQQQFESFHRDTMANYRAYDETINNIINSLIILQKILTTISKSHWCQKKVKQIKSLIERDLAQAKQKVEESLERRLNDASIYSIREYLEKNEKVTKLTIYSGQAELLIQKQEVENSLERRCAQMIQNMNRQSQGEVYEAITQKHLSSMEDMRKDLELLLELDFLKDKFKSNFEDAKQRLRNSFDSSFKNFNDQIKYTNNVDCEASSYSRNFEAIIKNTLHIIRYSSLINEDDETKKKVSELAASIQHVIEKQEDLIKELDFSKIFYPNNLSENIKQLLTKIQAHGTILKKNNRQYPQLFDPLNTRNQQIRNLLDEYISRPIVELKQRIERSLQQKRSSYFLINQFAGQIQICLAFIYSIPPQMGKNGQLQKNRLQFQAILSKVFRQLITNYYTFRDIQCMTDVLSEKYKFLKEMFNTFEYISGKHEISKFLGYRGLNTQGMVDEVSRKFKKWYSQVESRITNGSPDYNTKEIDDLLDSIDKIKYFQYTLLGKDTFKDLYQQILQGRVKKINNIQTKAQEMIKSENNIRYLFQELSEIYKECQQTDKPENLSIIKSIIKKLQQKQKEITKKIEQREQQIGQAHCSIGPTPQKQQSLRNTQQTYKSLILQYVDWCAKAKDFRFQGKKFQDTVVKGFYDQKLVFIQKITDEYLIERLKVVDQTLLQEYQMFLKAMKSYDLNRMENSYRLIIKIQQWIIAVKQIGKDTPKLKSHNCFQQLKKIVQKQPILKDQLKDQVQYSYSTHEIIKKVINCLHSHADQNYSLSAQYLKPDERFKAYYQSSQDTVKESLNVNIVGQYREKIRECQSIYKPDNQFKFLPQKIKQIIYQIIDQAASKFWRNHSQSSSRNNA